MSQDSQDDESTLPKINNKHNVPLQQVFTSPATIDEALAWDLKEPAMCEDVETMYSDMIYRMYAPAVVHGRETLIYREILRDEVEPKCGDYVRIHSGSSTETMILVTEDFESDLDVMTCKKGEYVIPKDEIKKWQHIPFDTKPEILYIMDSTGCQPGFVNLYKHQNKQINLEDSFGKSNEQLINIFRSSTALESFSESNQVDNATVHGPALTSNRTDLTTAMENDLVFCIPCPVWPDEAKEWIHRERCSLPSQETVESIVKSGCFVVPTDHPKSETPGKCWRLSFSVAEKLLIRSWTTKQVLVFHLLKYYLKHYKLNHPIESENVKVFSTYHIKTAVMWGCELFENWENESLVNLIRKHVDLMYAWITKGMYPGYWVKECNLLDQVTDVNYCKQFISSFSNMAEFLLTIVQSPLMSNVIELEGLAVSHRDVQFLYDAVVNDEISDWEQFLYSRKQAEQIDMLVNTWVKYLQYPTKYTTHDIEKLFSNLQANLKCSKIEVHSDVFSITKGRFYFVKHRYHRVKEKEDSYPDYLSKAIDCFNKALQCTSAGKDIIVDIALAFLANLYHVEGKFKKSKELCDMIIKHDIDPDYNSSPFGKVGMPELDFTYLELTTYELEQEEDFPLKPNVLAVFLKVKNMQALNENVIGNDVEYVNSLLEDIVDSYSANAQVGLLNWVRKQINSEK